jgi:hypothetical protein
LEPTASGPTSDDLEALANAVREAGHLPFDGDGYFDPEVEAGRRGHLRVLPAPDC